MKSSHPSNAFKIRLKSPVFSHNGRNPAREIQPLSLHLYSGQILYCICPLSGITIAECCGWFFLAGSFFQAKVRRQVYESYER